VASAHKKPSLLARLLGKGQPDPAPLPEGKEYFRIVMAHEVEAENATDAWLSSAGEKAPRTWMQLWTCMAVLDGLSSCRWGCAGGDHVVERLLARVFGSVRAALRLARAGLYDEALNALRTAGEVVNLLTLMQEDPELLSRWRRESPRGRYAMARPTKVIKALKELGREGSSLDADKYDLLSRIAHGNTETAPQAYNPVGVPLPGGFFQEAGFLVVLNEAALLTALAIIPGVALIDLEADVRHDLLLEGHRLVGATGSITLLNLDQALAGQRADALTEYESQLSENGDAGGSS
jgi:hypothetical protein